MKLKKKKYISIITIVTLILLVVAGIFYAGSKQNYQTKDNTNNIASDNQGDSDSKNTKGSSDEGNSDSDKGDSSDEAKEGLIDDPASAGTAWEKRLTDNSYHSSTPIKNDKEKDQISLPYHIPGSDLVILSYGPYSGVYLEDGSDSDINDVAAILVENTGDKDIEYCSITADDSSRILKFVGSAIPANSKVVIMAQNAEPYQSQGFMSVGTSVSDETDFTQSEDKVTIVSSEEGKIKIKNISNSAIPIVRVFYKFYLPDQDSFVGGITYNSVVEDLKPDEEREIEPSHFAGDASKIVMIRTYDSKY